MVRRIERYNRILSKKKEMLVIINAWQMKSYCLPSKNPFKDPLNWENRKIIKF